MLNQVLIDHFRCPSTVAEFQLVGELCPDKGFFRFGSGTICYGQSATGFRRQNPADDLYDSLADVGFNGSTVSLPFDPSLVIDDLRLEHYTNSSHNGSRHLAGTAVRKAYYALRPLLPVAIRKHLQRLYLRGWERKPFPAWPVDRTVEEILEKVLLISMKSHGIDELPFIWFWPEGAPGCVLMTHDVETAFGRDACVDLMNMDDSFGIKAAFQIVPERRYEVPEEFLEAFRERGFEIVVHDLNHDGRLYSERNEFLRRAELINQYGKKFGAAGFRAAVLYRNLDWLQSLDFKYDMSVPNVAHLDPQQGGCCTLFPYFVGDILELPVTTTQDYTLFYILPGSPVTLWETQSQLILEKHGLLSFIIHPDYIMQGKNQQTFKDLLSFLSRLRDEKKVWVALPREIDRWWRARNQMKLVFDSGKWRIEGPEKERARIAYARIENDRLVYEMQGTS
jgi:peptidoglycan/xylan/chitin deacetylase (PgdA/CDA1 family)